MDSYREHPGEYDLPATDESPPADVTVAIGTDERRMHVRAYNYWVSLLEGRDYPSIEDLEPGDVADFAANSVLLDFTCGRENPATPYIGAAIRRECDLDDGIRSIADVPSRSLLSRLTDHYLQIIANRAPIGFEAEFQNQRGEGICYRGILMPFSSDGDTIDFIYGVINWKQSSEPGAESVIVPQIAATAPADAEGADEEVLELEDPLEPSSSFDEGEAGTEPAFGSLVGLVAAPAKVEQEATNPGGIADPPAHAFGQPFARPVDFAPLAAAEEEDEEILVPELDEDAGLADRLWAARETAEAVKSADGRTRAALYQALSLAYDFALASQSNSEDYAELLEESGMKAQARAPMTPVVKLVFGIDYDKTRLTEFASALSYAQRQQIEFGGFQKFVERQSGGLKALVAAERQARRPEPKPDTKLEAGLERLRSASPLTPSDFPDDAEFVMVVMRRNADGVREAVALVDDAAMLDRAIRRAA